jgi:glucose/arabinose dehydrogenase
MKASSLPSLAVAALASLAACAPGDAGAQRDARAQRAQIDTTAGAEALTNRTYDGRLLTPPGFKVARFARVGTPRLMTMGPDGAVYVSRPGAGEVVRLADVNGDGVADSQTVAVRGLDEPHGLAFHKGYLYVAGIDGVFRVRLGPDGVARTKPERLNRYSGRGGHTTRTVIFGADSAMYVSIGSSCNVCVEKSPDRAAVMRYDEDGRNGRLYASGLRNAVGMAVHPGTNQIWVSQHERDNLRPSHEDLPPEEINILRDGAHYGWPYCWGDQHPNPEFDDRARCARTEPPALEMQAHSAPLGLAFLDKATAFPEEYRGDALLAFHGSWNRREPTGAKVVRIRVQNGRPVSYEDFITGWQDSRGKRWGQPVDVLVYRDGSVLVSDDAGGAIYRVYR